MKTDRMLKGLILRKILILFLLLLILQGLPALVSGVYAMSAIQNLARGIIINPEFYRINGNLQDIFIYLFCILYIPYFILFVIWFKMAYQNILLFDAKLDYRIGWAIGSFLVPIISLYRPYQICTEIMVESNPPESKENIKDALLVLFWWIMMVSSFVMTYLVWRGPSDSNSGLSGYLSYSRVKIFFNLVYLLLYMLSLALIVRIGNLQREKHCAILGMVKDAAASS